jgi:V/A-type H+-transporting ATPase subunit E
MVNQVEALEQAILARAEQLASQYRERASRSRDVILRDAAERLRLREQREEGIARSLGERAYRQQVQSQELKLQTKLDRVRWNLVRDVEGRLGEQLQAYLTDETAWLETLTGFIATAAERIERGQLLVRANSRDLRILKAGWASVTAAMPAGKTLVLDDEPIETLGGVMIISDDGVIRVDNTFDGRLARLRESVQRVILERLLPSSFDTGNIFGG